MAAAPTVHDRYWIVALGRALVALVAAAIITFAADHSARLGLVVFGGFAILTGLTVALVCWAVLAKGVLRTLFAVSGIVSVLLGALALLLQQGGLGWFLAIVSAWAAITGFIELYAGLRARRRHAAARDWLTMGGLTAILAIVFLVVPPDIAQHFRGPDGVDRSLTSSVILVGAFGAYCAIVCVYLAIGGFSLKWGTQSADAAALRAADPGPGEPRSGESQPSEPQPSAVPPSVGQSNVEDRA
ncbi:DUF308 domain-containing protein [Microbacterium sp. STN6]|uniref:DUF308 domain-containing protein n=1 Tax=Microbacterium sp. STN6 TaxID=2995588 RepID=UPI002260E090|nr:DUF308 domain-containing protein [Microbacterium sp. STN6]MCX7522790.1 DUF308 domain-containing protein [Microbacterium sp. STN6]